MKRIVIITTIGFFFLSISCNRISRMEHFISYWDQQPDRYWIGPEYWANRLQDWRIHNGRVECINGVEPMRTLHNLDHCLLPKTGNLLMRMETGRITSEKGLSESDWTGFLIGAGNKVTEYRRRALVHRNHGPGGGIIAALNGKGNIMFMDNETGDLIEPILINGSPIPPVSSEPVYLELDLTPSGEKYILSLSASYKQKKEGMITAEIVIEDRGRVSGNMAIIANGGADANKQSFWYRKWEIMGSKISTIPEQQFGPVMGVLYTLSNNILKLTAQMAPISPADQQEIVLELKDEKTGKWSAAAVSQVIIPGYTAHFRITGWNSDVTYDFRIKYLLHNRKGINKEFNYYGVIANDPEDKEEIVVAAFTGNSNSDGMGNGLFNFSDYIWFPHEDLTAYVSKHNPDLLVYTGDNVYESRPTPPDFSSEENTAFDYLYKWYMFFWAHGTLTKNTPAIVIPDDHDVYHGNLWGAGGVAAPPGPENGKYPDYYKGYEPHWQQDQGGFKLAPGLVNMIQRTQTSNLPDPYDPDPVAQGIGVYFCNLNFGRISFAILEDRKFKSAPGKLLPDKKVVNGFSLIKWVDGRSLDRPEATLLGERQLKFLEEWSSDWTGVDMKVAISQTIFANVSTFPDSFIIDAGTPRLLPLPQGEIPKDYIKAKDMDSNGWPQTGRNKALRAIRKGFGFMIGGDQHLGSVVHHGTDEWEDAGFSFCVPSIANLWPRRWFPPAPGENHQEGMPLYTGRYFDGFGNRITVYAVSNPYISGREPALLYDRAPGYGIIRFNKKNHLITMECWPRYSDPGSKNAEQYPGWPITINLDDNYGKTPRGWLPVFKVTGLDHPPVFQIIDEQTNEIVYTFRPAEYNYQPKIFKYGIYTIKVGEPGTSKMKTLTGIRSSINKGQEEISLEF